MQFVCCVLACAVAAPLAAPPKSDNEGKIVGKWESVSANTLPKEVQLTLEFTKEGKFTMTVTAPGGTKAITGTYTLGAGSEVTLDNLSEPISGTKTHKEKVVIADGKLTMSDTDGQAVTFRAVKEKK